LRFASSGEGFPRVKQKTAANWCIAATSSDFVVAAVIGQARQTRLLHFIGM
jgi:hypothetical protein